MRNRLIGENNFLETSVPFEERLETAGSKFQ